MEEAAVKGSVFLFLLLNSILDFKRREISLRSLILFAMVGIVLNLWLDYQSIWSCLSGVGVGLFLLLAAFLTNEAVGFGDGLVVCVTGLYLGFWANMELLLTGLLFCLAAMGAGILIRRLRRTARFPLVPFLLLAWIVRMLQ